mmetsp:Transcript_66602/g.147527  ORF Transcript_66602/g.147527 Transcript_66602/m.147527 type:complete len:300 (-) Transcript_66602:115-1014(-)
MAISLRVFAGLSGEMLCTFTASRTWTLQSVRLEVERLSGTPRLEQRLLVAGRPWREEETLGEVLMRSGDPEGAAPLPQQGSMSLVEVSVLKVDPAWAAVLGDVESGWVELRDLNEDLRRNREVVIAAVRASGCALQHAPEELQDDREVVLAAVRTNGSALRHASEALKRDKEIVLAAVQTSALALRCAAEELWKDRDFTLNAVQVHGSALLYAPLNLRADREVVLAAVRNDPSALRHAVQALHYDPEVQCAVGVAGAPPPAQHSGASRCPALPSGRSLKERRRGLRVRLRSPPQLEAVY